MAVVNVIELSKHCYINFIMPQYIYVNIYLVTAVKGIFTNGCYQNSFDELLDNVACGYTQI